MRRRRPGVRSTCGYPLNHRERFRHIAARQEYIQLLLGEHPDDSGSIIQRLDKEDPAFYVKWYEARSAEA
jgi:hypothetical protein